ncbi:hypothetical protein [Actinoplanes sp. NPDC026623]|uniref:hypothetical protein n=1 Tax=Actinoplanes sp. NPDC026623 TaxID=3155610 RepID=UPI0033F1CF18
MDTTHAAEPLCTQGQVWMVMYSDGIPALLVFLFFFVVIARRLAAAVEGPVNREAATPDRVPARQYA